MANLLAFACVLALAAQALGNNCKVSKVENGGEVHFDISILQKTLLNTDRSGLNQNWIAYEKGATHDKRGRERHDFKYYLNVCGELVNKPNAMDVDTAIFQEVAKDKNETYTIGINAYSELTSLRDGDLRYEFGPGEKSHTCDHRHATILFFCQDIGLGSPVFVEETAGCEYFFVWNTCAACPVGSPIRNSCPAKANVCHFIGGSGSLSSGAVLLITFFVLLFFYLVVGVLYKRFVSGAKGIEQLPNADFWFDACESIKDGCSYTFCCSRPPAGFSVQYTEPVGGLDDDAFDDLDDDADEEPYP